MQAWRVTGQGEPGEVLRLVNDVKLPDPGPGQIQLRVAAAGVGLPDVAMCRGSYPLTPALPFTPGQEAAGIVTAVGEGAVVAVGERVMAVTSFFLGHGGFAEECHAVGDFALPIPDAMDDAEAAVFAIPFHTAYVGLVRRASLTAGETLVVLGAAGGTGSAALQLGRALGARVVAVAGGDEKREFCRALGAEVTLDSRSEDLVARVREATDGRGADVIYDPVGGALFQAATRFIAHEGRLLAVGFGSGSWGAPKLAHLVQGNYSVMGVMPSGYDREFKLAAHAELLAHWSAGRLRVPLHERFAFERVPEALELLAQNRAMGKIVVELTRSAS